MISRSKGESRCKPLFLILPTHMENVKKVKYVKEWKVDRHNSAHFIEILETHPKLVFGLRLNKTLKNNQCHLVFVMIYYCVTFISRVK